MNFTEIAENYSKTKRGMMTDAVIRNQKHMRNFSKYHSESLNIMFAEWDLLFPKNIHETYFIWRISPVYNQ